jgi:hypothetical protein
MTQVQFALNAVGVLAMLIQVVLPLLVALVTKWQTSGAVKGIILLVFTALTQFLTLWYQAASDTLPFDWKTVLFNIVVGFVISVSAYFGVLRTSQPRVALQSAANGGTPDVNQP